MEQDTIQTAIDRFYTLLHWQLAAQLPRPGGVHIYSKGAMIAGYVSRKTADGWVITISDGIDYGSLALGFNDDGSKRTPRGPLEALNFKIVENAIRDVAKVVAIPSGGKVVINIWLILNIKNTLKQQ